MTSQLFIGPSVVVAFAVGLCAVLACLMPRLSRPDVYFAVTVPPAFRDSDEGESILKRYRVEIVIFSALALLVVLSGVRIPQPNYLALLTLGGLFFQLLGVFVAFYRARGRVLPRAVAPASVREVALVPREARLPGGWLLQAPPFALLAAAAVWLYVHWDEIPETFPVHWGANGQPNNWATRSFAGVYAPLLVGAVMCALLGFLAFAMLHWSRLIRVGGAAGENEQRFRRTVAAILVATEYLLAVTFVWTGTLPLTHQQAGPPGVSLILGLSLAFVVVTVVVLVRLGQGGTRLDGAATSSSRVGAPIGDRTPDRCWKLGLFYINRDDPALFVEKRFGVGYTLNFGHPGVWVFLAVLVGVLVAVVLFAPSHHGG